MEKLSMALPRWTSLPSPASRSLSSASRVAIAPRHRRNARALGPDQSESDIESRRNLPRSHDRPGGRRRAAEDAQRDRPEHSFGWPDDHFSAGCDHLATVRHLLWLAADGVRPGFAAGVPDSHDDRWI